jgi:alginate O-acetyltransferase complex protein AlgI
MLFTTATFTFLFLPIVATGYFMLGRTPRAAVAWLGLASMVFYGYWMPVYVVLLLGSISINFRVGVIIGQLRDVAGCAGRRRARRVLIAGIVFNLGLLSYFKYANFFLNTLNVVSGTALPSADVVLPIGISFFTFTQIAFLVDTWQKGTREYRFIPYLLFVTYFPHLVAGPVLHHAQMMPQLSNVQIYRVDAAKVAPGLALFTLGLLKKIVFADGVAPYADCVFDGAAAGHSATTLEAWIGPLAYTFELYFDFSGYSDMAVGLSMIFGITLPYNFASPYRATSISEFWRRWHMTLSAFLRDYLYIPLGGNRIGEYRRVVNLLTTMVLGGLWHGANWTFVVWGGLHGLYLAIHRAFRRRFANALTESVPKPILALLGWLLTMFAVIIAWVFFRAATFEAAGRIISAMFTSSADTTLPKLLWNAGLDPLRGAWLIAVCAGIATFPVNSNVLFEYHREVCARSAPMTWFSIGAASVAVSALIIVNEMRSTVSPFIYFNF